MTRRLFVITLAALRRTRLVLVAAVALPVTAFAESDVLATTEWFEKNLGNPKVRIVEVTWSIGERSSHAWFIQ